MSVALCHFIPILPVMIATILASQLSGAWQSQIWTESRGWVRIRDSAHHNHSVISLMVLAAVFKEKTLSGV